MAKILMDGCGADVLGSPTVAFRSSGCNQSTAARMGPGCAPRSRQQPAKSAVRLAGRPFPARFAIRSISSRSANSLKERETAGRSDGCGLGKPIYIKTKGHLLPSGCEIEIFSPLAKSIASITCVPICWPRVSLHLSPMRTHWCPTS